MSTASIKRRWEWTTVGLLLCLLAALFAIEAKLAWYSPEGAPASQVSASKLQPADAPRVAAHAIAASHTAPHFLEIVAVLFLALMIGVTGPAVPASDPRPRQPILSAFSLQLFFRPPPAL